MGIVEHVGYEMAFKVLTNDTHKIIYRSNIRRKEDTDTPNLRLNLFDRKESTQFITSK